MRLQAADLKQEFKSGQAPRHFCWTKLHFMHCRLAVTGFVCLLCCVCLSVWVCVGRGGGMCVGVRLCIRQVLQQLFAYLYRYDAVRQDNLFSSVSHLPAPQALAIPEPQSQPL